MATTFEYRAKDKTGKVTEGQIEGSSRDAVVKALRDKGAVPLAVNEVKTSGLQMEINIPGLSDRVKSKDVAVFSRQFDIARQVVAGRIERFRPRERRARQAPRDHPRAAQGRIGICIGVPPSTIVALLHSEISRAGAQRPLIAVAV